MCDTKPKFPKLEARIAELGFNKTTLTNDDSIELNHQALGRRLRGDVQFELHEIIWLMNKLDASFDELFSEIN